jgi:hypothetical protein
MLASNDPDDGKKMLGVVQDYMVRSEMSFLQGRRADLRDFYSWSREHFSADRDILNYTDSRRCITSRVRVCDSCPSPPSSVGPGRFLTD